MKKIFFLIFIALSFLTVFAVTDAAAASGATIDANVDASLVKFNEIAGSKEVLKKAEGILVFPKVYKAGIGIGGEFGEGALRINGKTVDYYNTAAASIGFQLGGQKKTIIIVFMEKGALDNFRNATGWKVGVDASVAVIAIGAGGTIDTAQINKPIIGFILDQKGLMYNLTLEGSKITKINK